VRARTVLALAVAAPWVGFALLRGLALDRWVAVLVPVVSFAPWAALTAPVPVLLALALRRPAVAALALAAAATLAVAVVPRALDGPSPSPRPRGSGLTVMASNLLVGTADPAAVVALVRERRVDVLCLVELPAVALGRFDAAGLRELLPHRALDPDRARGGNGSAVLSRHPLTPITRVGRPAVGPAALVRVPGAPPVRVQAVHPPPPIDRASVDAWRRDLAALPTAGGAGPLVVLAGDFNATLDHHALRRVLDRGYADAADAVGAGLRPTWPRAARRPPLTIDHVLADRRVAVEALTVHDVAGSDHSAVVADLVLPELP
jgi:endonuclease/exonuclease/phosphatase (EEP) superfamily protein YafD